MADASFHKTFMATDVVNLFLYTIGTEMNHWTGAQHWQ